MSGFSINTVTVSGNLTRDPELRSLPSGVNVCGISIAHNDRVKDSSGEWVDRVNYFDITVWSGLGEWVGKNMHKGDGITVSGRLKWRSWETDGQKRSAVDITADSIQPRDNGGNGGGGRSGPQAVPDETSFSAPVGAEGFKAATKPVDDGTDIPFLWEGPVEYERRHEHGSRWA